MSALACPQCGEQQIMGGHAPTPGCVFFCEKCVKSFRWDGTASRPVTPAEERNMGWVDRCPHCKVSVFGIVNAQTRTSGRPPQPGEGFFCAFCGGVALYSSPPKGSPVQALMLRQVTREDEKALPPYIREYIDLLRRKWESERAAKGPAS